MNGLYNIHTAAQLSADSSGMMNMSDSEFGSSDSSSFGIPHPPDPLTNGDHQRMMMMGNIVQNQTYVTQYTGAFSYPNNSNQGQIYRPMKSPSGGKPAVMKQQACMTAMNHDSTRNNNTDQFLNQFEAQMSQMKSAMDAVQNEIFFHSSPAAGGGKPRAVAAMIASAVPPIKRGPGRPRGSGSASTTAASQSSGPVRYQSQISAINGLKLKIKKSPRQLKRKGAKGKGRKKKRKGDEDDDDDFDDDEEISDGEMDHRKPSQKSTKLTQFETGNGNGDQDDEPSGWGDALPENVLEKILSYAVKYEEGCIPVLVR